METKTFFRFFSKLPLYIEGSVEVPHSFFTLHLFKDSNINKYKVILNDSVANNRDYFSLYDLKVIIDNNIDYIISNKFYVPNMDAYVFDGKIFTLEEKKYPDEDVFNLIIKDAGGKDE